jgi:hypothetical protein
LEECCQLLVHVIDCLVRWAFGHEGVWVDPIDIGVKGAEVVQIFRGLRVQTLDVLGIQMKLHTIECWEFHLILQLLCIALLLTFLLL